MNELRRWLIRILIEHYPRYTKDYWKCDRLLTEICNLGDVHIINGLKRN